MSSTHCISLALNTYYKRIAIETLGEDRVRRNPLLPLESTDDQDRQTKVVLKCASEAELDELQVQAQRLNLCARAIRDACVMFGLLDTEAMLIGDKRADTNSGGLQNGARYRTGCVNSHW